MSTWCPLFVRDTAKGFSGPPRTGGDRRDSEERPCRARIGARHSGLISDHDGLFAKRTTRRQVMPVREPPLTRIGTLKNLPDGYWLSVAENESTMHGKANASYPGLGCNKTEPSSIVHVRRPRNREGSLMATFLSTSGPCCARTPLDRR